MIDEAGGSLAYLLGIPRSGTTLLAYLLNQNSAIHAPPEPWVMLALQCLGQVPARHPADGALLGQAFRDFCDDRTLNRAKAAFAAMLYNDALTRTGKTILVDKTPRYYQILPELLQVFPDARFIWLKRNPFAVAASLKATWSFNLLEALESKVDHPLLFDLVLGLRRLAVFFESPSDAMIAVHYERLVTDPAGTMSEVFSFLGAPPEAISGEIDPAHPFFGATRMGDSKIRETDHIHRDSLDRWEEQLSPAEIQAVADCFGSSFITRLGYSDGFERARRHGITEPRQEATSAIVARIEAEYETCLAGVAQTTPPGLDGDLRRQLDEKEQVIQDLLRSERHEVVADLRRQLEEKEAVIQRLLRQ